MSLVVDGKVSACIKFTEKKLPVFFFLCLIIEMCIRDRGATVKIGGFIPRAVASTPTRSIPHSPMGAGWAAPSAAIPKNNGHAFMGSLTVLADGMPFSVSYTHLQITMCL